MGTRTHPLFSGARDKGKDILGVCKKMKWQIFKLYQGHRKIRTYIVGRNINFLEDTLVASIQMFKNISTFPNSGDLSYSSPHPYAQIRNCKLPTYEMW